MTDLTKGYVFEAATRRPFSTSERSRYRSSFAMEIYCIRPPEIARRKFSSVFPVLPVPVVPPIARRRSSMKFPVERRGFNSAARNSCCLPVFRSKISQFRPAGRAPLVFPGDFPARRHLRSSRRPRKYCRGPITTAIDFYLHTENERRRTNAILTRCLVLFPRRSPRGCLNIVDLYCAGLSCRV